MFTTKLIEEAVEETKIGGDPQKGIVFALAAIASALHEANQVAASLALARSYIPKGA